MPKEIYCSPRLLKTKTGTPVILLSLPLIWWRSSLGYRWRRLFANLLDDLDDVTEQMPNSQETAAILAFVAIVLLFLGRYSYSPLYFS